MKGSFIASILFAHGASMGAMPPTRTSPLVDSPTFTIDFEHVKTFKQTDDVKRRGFHLLDKAIKGSPGRLTLGTVETPVDTDALDRTIAQRQLDATYGDMEGHFLRIDNTGKDGDVTLVFGTKANVVTFDYVLSNSIKRTDPFEYTFTCRYSSGRADEFPVTVANPARLSDRTRGKITCHAPAGTYVRSIGFSNAKDGCYETWIDNIVGFTG